MIKLFRYLSSPGFLTGYAGSVLFALLFAFGAEAQVFTESNLPIVIINTSVSIPNNNKVPGTMKIINNGPGQRNHITDPPNEYNGSIGIEIHGSYSTWFPQKSYSIETRDAQQNELKCSLFGWPEETDYMMLTHYGDKALLRNELAFKMFTDMGNYASRFVWAEAVINNQYSGIYLFGERIKRDSARVNIAKLKASDNSGNAVTGGYIFKLDYWDNTNSWLSNYHPIGHPDFDVHFVYHYPKLEDITSFQKEYIQSYVNSFESTLYSPFFKDPVNGFRKYIDEQTFIDYFLVNEVSRNNDGFKKSRYFYKDKNSRNPLIKAGPVWDFDWAWKNIDECSIFAQTDGSGWAYKVNDCYPDNKSPGYYIRLFQDTVFANNLRCRWETLKATVLNKDSILAWVDANVLYLWEAQQRHFIRYPLSQNNVIPEVPPIPQTYQGEINKLKNWIVVRLNWLDANLPGYCCTVGLPVAGNKTPSPLVFPNPAIGLVFVESGAFTPETTIIIYDVSGKTIPVSYRFDGLTFSFDVSKIPSGIYFIQAIQRSGEGLKPAKMLVKH